MSELVERIKRLIPYLPEKDRPYGYKFIKDRDFQSLQELVDSAYIIVKRARKKDKESYPEVNLRQVLVLRGRVRDYCDLLEIPEQESELEELEEELNEIFEGY